MRDILMCVRRSELRRGGQKGAGGAGFAELIPRKMGGYTNRRYQNYYLIKEGRILTSDSPKNRVIAETGNSFRHI